MMLAIFLPCAAAAPIENSMAERSKPCEACHGKQGGAGVSGFYPRIAGKPAGYLFNQLVAFRDGTRVNGAMAHLLSGMPDYYLKDFAKYFAAQSVAYEGPSLPKADAMTLELGRKIVQEGDVTRAVPACVSCHGQRLLGVEPAVPGLIGLPIGYLSSQLGAWRSGLRTALVPDCMAQIAHRLDQSQLNAAVAWLGAQGAPPDAHPDTAALLQTPLDCGSLHDTEAAK